MATKVVKWVVTANYTGDGGVAYMRADKSFTAQAAEAAVLATKDEAEALCKHALQAERIVSDPYLIEVAGEPGALDLLTARERIRATGPTVPVRRPDPQPASR
jgi:hypothetical protein